MKQAQIIQSLAEALNWFEKELEWGVSPAELSHLTGRIGELYAAMITRGQMALETNQRGYDVISAENDRVSVKTITSSTHVSFNQNTFDQVDRVIVLRINVDDENGVSVEELLDADAKTALSQMRESRGKYIFSTTPRYQKRSVDELQMVAKVNFENFEVRRFENSGIQVLVDGEVQLPAKPHLRDIARKIGVEVGEKTTHQLGRDIVRELQN